MAYLSRVSVPANGLRSIVSTIANRVHYACPNRSLPTNNEIICAPSCCDLLHMSSPPLPSSPLQWMAEALCATGRESLAAQCLQQALETQPAGARPTLLLLRLALALARSGAAANATGLLSEAIGQSPGDPLTRYVLAVQKLNAGDAKGARKELKRVADVLPPAAALLSEVGN